MRIGLLAVMLVAVGMGLAATDASAQQEGLPPPECAQPTAPSAKAAITIYPESPLFAESFGEVRVPGPPLKFRTRVSVLLKTRKGDRVIVKMVDGSQCGYIQASRILDNPPLKVSDIDPNKKVQKGFFGYVRNEWTLKAMLRSNPKHDTSAQEATLFDAPGGEGKAYKSTRVFTLFNIFHVDKNSSSDPEDWWFFVGGNKVADDKVLSGWVRGGNLFLWGSGVALYTNPNNRDAPFDVYTDIQMLQSADKAGRLATRSGLEPPGNRDIAKFPILDQIFKNDITDMKAGTPPIAYEIGFFGGAEGCGQATCDASAEIGDKIAALGKIVRTARKIDVMFVIDNTDSMTAYFQPLARAVSRWAAEAKSKVEAQGGRIRFGASVYGDYHDPKNPSKEKMDFRIAAQLDTDSAKFERALSAITTPYGDAVGDQPEAGYAALVRTAQETHWAEDAGYRLLVWIGDQGVAREPGKLPFDPVDYTQVQRELKDKELFLTSINVDGSKPLVSTFMADANRLLDRDKLALGGGAVRASDAGSKASRQEFEQAAGTAIQILNRVLDLSKAVTEFIQNQRGKNYDAASAPKNPETVASFAATTNDLPITKLANFKDLEDGLFKRLGLSPEEVQRVMNLKQLMTKGIVGYDEKQRNIAFFAAIEPRIFGQFQGALAELCRAMSDDDDLRNRMVGLMLTLAHNLGGDPYSPAESMAEYFDRIIFIPKRHFASWLDKSASEFANVWGTASAEEKNKYKLSACRSAYLLQQMNLGLKVDSIEDLDFDAQLGKIQPKPGREPKTYVWLWSTDSRIEYYFVPADYLPHD